MDTLKILLFTCTALHSMNTVDINKINYAYSQNEPDKKTAFARITEIKFDLNHTNQVWGINCNSNGIYSNSNIVLYSNNVKILLDIYKLYDYEIKGDCHYLYNKTTKERINDIVLDDKGFKFVKIYTPEIQKIKLSYERWIQLVNKIGLTQVRQKHISPLDGTPYVWK